MESEKEVQIQKIHDLLNSNDEANIELGIQLMVNLGLIKELPEKFQRNDIIIKESNVTGIGNSSEEFGTKYLKKLDTFLVKVPKYRRKIFNLMTVLLHQFSINPHKIPKVILKLSIINNKAIISSEAMYCTKEVKPLKEEFDKIMTLKIEEIKYYYKEVLDSFTNENYLHSFRLDFMDIRRRNSKVELLFNYEEFNEEYSFVKFQLTININT